MAIASGKQTTEGGVGKVLFTGVAPFKILAVNPNKKTLESIYGREIEKEPEYLSEDEKGVKKIRIDFIVQTVINENLGVNVEEINKISYFLENAPRLNKDGSKCQIINLYGEPNWATQEELKAGKLPENLSFYPMVKARPAFIGEVELVEFVRTYLGIPKRQFYNSNSTNDNKWENIKNVSEAEIQFDNIKEYFKGNIKEILSAINSFPDNKFKMLCGVKTTDDNKQYQSFFTQMPLRYGTTKYDYLGKILKEKLDAGSYGNVDFGPDGFAFRIYTNKPTKQESPGSLWGGIQNDSSSQVDDDPLMSAFGPSESTPWFGE